MTWPDVEGGLRDYLRAYPAVDALVHGRVFFGVPSGAQYPLVVVRRVGGGADRSEAPIDAAAVAVDVYGPGTRAQGEGQNRPNKAATAAVMGAVRDACDAVRGNTALNATTYAYGAEVISVVWAPDPDTDRPRYTLTVAVTARAIAA